MKIHRSHIQSLSSKKLTRSIISPPSPGFAAVCGIDSSEKLDKLLLQYNNSNQTSSLKDWERKVDTIQNWVISSSSSSSSSSNSSSTSYNLVEKRVLKLAPLIHPSFWDKQQNVLKSNFSMLPLQTYGDAAISFTVSISQFDPHLQQQQQQDNNKNDKVKKNSIEKLQEADFLCQTVRSKKWSQLLLFPQSPSNAIFDIDDDDDDTNEDPVKKKRVVQREEPDETICVAALVAIVGSVYVDRGLDAAVDFTLKLL